MRAAPWALLALALPGLIAASPAAAAERPDLDSARRWVVFYGRILSSRTLESLDLAVLDPDAFAGPAGGAPGPAGSRPLRLAYVSAGEADERRGYWAASSSRPYLVEPNPDWPGAHRVDLRSPKWRALLLDRVVPEALGRGYQGVFLDTLDTAEYLEAKDPQRFAGSVAAARELIASLRQAHPAALILVNNALPLLEGSAQWIDGVVVEDLYTRCPPRGGACGPTPEPVAREKEAALSAFRLRSGKPVFVLLYSELGRRDSRWVRAAVRRCRANGFLPYLTDPGLMGLGRVAP